MNMNSMVYLLKDNVLIVFYIVQKFVKNSVVKEVWDSYFYTENKI